MHEPPPPPLKPREDGTFVGLGWDRVAVAGGKQFGLDKDGSWFGMRTFLRRQPNGVSWALLFNASMNPDTTDARAIVDAVRQVRAVLDRPERLPDIDLFGEFR
jgi:hypothetical protein